MNAEVKEVYPVAAPLTVVTIKRGFCLCDETEFESVWNDGSPNISITETETISLRANHAYLDTGDLEDNLDVALAKFIAKELGDGHWHLDKLQTSAEVKHHQISMAMPIKEVTKCAIGILQYSAVKA